MIRLLATDTRVKFAGIYIAMMPIGMGGFGGPPPPMMFGGPRPPMFVGGPRPVPMPFVMPAAARRKGNKAAQIWKNANKKVIGKLNH